MIVIADGRRGGKTKKSNELIDWLKNWKPMLLEVVIIAGTLVSGVTTDVGAYAYVNQNLLVALVFTLFVQGSYLCSGTHEPTRRSMFAEFLDCAALFVGEGSRVIGGALALIEKEPHKFFGRIGSTCMTTDYGLLTTDY